MKHGVRRQNLSVALFPFLAVLICTMGALIVLLVLFTHQARVEAKTVAATRTSAANDPDAVRKLRERLEDANWRREMLVGQRAEKSQKLAEERARLAHLEQHIQQLQAQARELLDRARQIDEGKQLNDEQLAAERAKLAQWKDEIAARQRELDEARRQQETAQRWYALIPYDGPNGTRRRPIYIECTDAGIVVQPEGIVFRPDDFNGPLGPGNPLDAALRTIREHLQAVDSRAGEPYPLLVVRPSGVVAYGAARAALKSWDDEFGYELISDDKRLAFGEPDPALAEALHKAVSVARLRQVALAAAMPRKFNGDQPLRSFDPADVPGLGSASGGGVGGLPGAKTGRGVGSGVGGMGGGSSGTQATPGSGSGGLGEAPPHPGAGQSSGPSLGSPTGEGTIAGGAAGATNSGAAGSGVAGAVGPAAGQPGPYPTTGAAGGAYGAAGGSAAAGPAGSPSAAASGVAGPSAGAAGSNSPGAYAGSSVGGTPSGVRSGKSRGANWGLPGAAGRTTGITRPIHVAVLADRFVLVPDPGDDRPPQHLRISPVMTQAEADALVAAIQKEMSSWGLAVENGYWKPILEVEVAPDAERHFADLQTALQNSGFEIQRKP
jgi:hypothetical protein